MKSFRELTRPLRRLFKPFLSRADMEAVAHAVALAEAKTTGEIRVHLTGSLEGMAPLEAARVAFARLGLEKTRARTAVLILVCDLDHRFAIWGDKGLHAKAGQELWDDAARALTAGLSSGKRAEGLIACVELVGAALAAHFPREAGDDPNELPDEVTRD